MGRRGPKPEPTESKRARGNPGRRQLEQPIEVGGRKMPAMPSALRGNARAQTLWRKTGPMLVEAGILDKVDGPTFGTWCLLQAEADRLALVVAKMANDRTISNNDGKTTQLHPTYTAWSKVAKQAADLGTRFGLDPSGRTGLTGNKPSGADTPGVDDVGPSPRLRGIPGGRSTAG